MKVKILFDKDAINKDLRIGWGVSFLVNEEVLFDTGENGCWLLENIRNLKVDINKIRAVVISHDHWDHTEGLWELLEDKRGLTVYACPNFSLEFKRKVKMSKGKLIETGKVTEISKDIFVTGEIAGEYKGRYMPEQAIVAKTKKGLSVITGCAHPGIIKMVEKVENEFPGDQIYLVFGGFHLMNEDARIIKATVEGFKNMAVEKAGPTHCSGKVAEEVFKEEYGNNCVSVKVGNILEI